MAYNESRPVYRHTQDVASTAWEVNHGLNTPIPYCTIWVDMGDGVPTVIIPKEIRILSTNACRISFSSARSGVAVIN